jgi:hypothetical protein
MSIELDNNSRAVTSRNIDTSRRQSIWRMDLGCLLLNYRFGNCLCTSAKRIWAVLCPVDYGM